MALSTSTWKSRWTLGSDHFGVSKGAAGRGKSSGSSSVRNNSRGRHWVVPWMRMPAVVLHQVSAAHPAVGEVDEGLSGEEVVLHVVDDAFDSWLVGRGGHPGGVDDEAPRLGVLDEGVVEPRRGVLGLGDDRLHVVGNDDGEHPAEVAPGRLEAPDDLFGGLEERRPDELVAAEAGREDEPVADPPPLPVGNEPEASEVDLELVVPAAGRRPGP